MNIADIGFFFIELGAWFVIGKSLIKKDYWNKNDSYWLFIGSPMSCICSFLANLPLYGFLWIIWTILLLIKKYRSIKISD